MCVFIYMHDCVIESSSVRERDRERETERERFCVFIVPSIIPISCKVGNVP